MSAEEDLKKTFRHLWWVQATSGHCADDFEALAARVEALEQQAQAQEAKAPAPPPRRPPSPAPAGSAQWRERYEALRKSVEHIRKSAERLAVVPYADHEHKENTYNADYWRGAAHAADFLNLELEQLLEAHADPEE